MIKLNLENISDIHIKMNSPQDSLVYPGPRRVNPEEFSMVIDLMNRCKSYATAAGGEFMVNVDNIFWRGQRDSNVVDGEWFRLRRKPDLVPSLDTLACPLPGHIKSQLLDPELSGGGLIYVVGGPGAGKTTTACATVISRLHAYGGSAYTIEDPAEVNMNGWQGNGYCTQTNIRSGPGAWSTALRVALRSQPVGTNLMLMVGEIREAEAARIILRAASNGFLVISTGFGTDIISGISTLSHLMGSEFNDGLASVLKLVVHTKINNNIIAAQSLKSNSPSSQVACLIRQGRMNMLNSEIQYQMNSLAKPNSSFNMLIR